MLVTCLVPMADLLACFIFGPFPFWILTWTLLPFLFWFGNTAVNYLLFFSSSSVLQLQLQFFGCRKHLFHDIPYTAVKANNHQTEEWTTPVTSTELIQLMQLQQFPERRRKKKKRVQRNWRWQGKKWAGWYLGWWGLGRSREVWWTWNE